MSLLLLLFSTRRIRFFAAWNYEVFRDMPFVLVAEKPFSAGLRLSLQIKRALGNNWLTERKRMQSSCVSVLSLYRGIQLCSAFISRGSPLKLTFYQSIVVEGYNSNGQFLHFCFDFVLNCNKSKTHMKKTFHDQALWKQDKRQKKIWVRLSETFPTILNVLLTVFNKVFQTGNRKLLFKIPET